MAHRIYFDGGTALNAICIYDADRHQYFVENVEKGLTNNTLEYMALLKAAKYATGYYGQTTMFELCGDSELIIKQMKGENAVNKQHLVSLKAQVQSVLEFYTHKLIWVPREKNKAGVVLEEAQLLTRKNLYD